MRREEVVTLFPKNVSANANTSQVFVNVSFGIEGINNYRQIDDLPRTPGKYQSIWDKPGLRSGSGLVSGQVGQPSGCPPAPNQTPLVHTHTPDRGTRKPFRTASDKRCFSRMMLGLKQPGRYYFWTLTSSPESPDFMRGWDNLRKWLKKNYVGIAHMHVIVDEGCKGVIHMVIRMPFHMKNIKVKAVSAFWKESHNAPIVWVKRVDESKKEDLANYLSDQRKKRSMGSEFSWQPAIITWGWSKGWIPQGFTKQFGKFWQDWRGMPIGERESWLHSWIQKCHKNQKLLRDMGIKSGICNDRPKVSDWYVDMR